MKRKDTSKLLNEWKNFLNEVENNEMELSPDTGFDVDKNREVRQDSLSENEDFETIIGIMFEKGKSSEEIHAEIQRLAQKSPEEIAAIAQNTNDSFYEDSLEDDEHLSFSPKE